MLRTLGRVEHLTPAGSGTLKNDFPTSGCLGVFRTEGGSESHREAGRGSRAGVDFGLSFQTEEDFTRQGGRGSSLF